MATADLRVASYNIRVDHTADRDSVHEWSKRRNLAATVRRLGTVTRQVFVTCRP